MASPAFLWWPGHCRLPGDAQLCGVTQHLRVLSSQPGAQALANHGAQLVSGTGEPGAVTLLTHRGGLRAGFAENFSTSQETAGKLYLGS